MPSKDHKHLENLNFVSAPGIGGEKVAPIHDHKTCLP